MFIDYTYEPRRAIFFEDVKSNYASIECVERGLHPLDTFSMCHESLRSLLWPYLSFKSEI